MMLMAVLIHGTDNSNPQETVRCYRRYGQYLFKPVEFWQELDKYGRIVFRINEFYDFPFGFMHQTHQYLNDDICWRYRSFITDFQLPSFVPQVDRDEYYDGCQIQIKRLQFEDLRIVCDITEYECHQTLNHPIIQMNVNACSDDKQ